LGSDKGSMGAFLFTWPDGNTKGAKPIKLPKVGTEQMAVIDRMDQGPQARFQLFLPLIVLVSAKFVKSIRIVEVAVHKRLQPFSYISKRGAPQG
ncbi:hypothetical protein DUNSADRAFT_4688, partial [Dunaliella salina]